MNEFDFTQAQDREAALEQLAGTGSVVPLAGGTNLLVNLKRAPLDADLVVDLSRVASLNSITEDDNGMRLGCGVTFAQILEWHPGGVVETLMQPMAAAFAGPPIRNLATVGGNICDASPAADVCPPRCPIIISAISAGIATNAIARIYKRTNVPPPLAPAT